MPAREEAATLGAAAKLLSKDILQVQVAEALENLPIVYPQDGRISGTPHTVVDQIIESHDRPLRKTVKRDGAEGTLMIIELKTR